MEDYKETGCRLDISMSLLVYPCTLSPHLARFSAAWLSFTTAESIVLVTGLCRGNCNHCSLVARVKLRLRRGQWFLENCMVISKLMSCYRRTEFAGQGSASSSLISIASTYLYRCMSGCLAKGRDNSAFFLPPLQLSRGVLSGGHTT